MDPLYYSRIAISGWVFLAVLLLSFWETNCYQWGQLVSLTSKDQATFVLGVFGAIVGIGGPPAIGFILDRVVSIILLCLKRNIWNYATVHSLRKYFDSFDQEKVEPSAISDGGLFHAIFLTHADAKLVEWTRRVRSYMFGSYSAAASIVAAIVFTFLKFGVYAFWTDIFASIMIVLLVSHGNRELRSHREVVTGWVEIYGKSFLIPTENHQSNKP